MIKLALAVFAMVAPFATAQTSTWTIDPAHSEVDFTVRRLEFTAVQGRLGRISGKLDVNQADVTKSTAQITIDLMGLDTKDDLRDEHLRSDAFFEVSVFPTAKFASTSVVRNGSGLTVTGLLTLHGFTKPVILRVDTLLPSQGTDNRLHTSYRATATIDRSAFAVGNAYPEAAISDAVDLIIQLDTVKKQ